jgi:hypothetical protein
VEYDALPEKRLPLFHSALFVSTFFKLLALLPIPLLPDVQNGITVFPDKSACSTKVYVIFGASPHQIG